MATEYKQRFCITCDKFVRTEKPGINYLFHLVMCLVTLGWWFPVLSILMGVHVFKGFHCPGCGGKNFAADKPLPYPTEQISTGEVVN